MKAVLIDIKDFLHTWARLDFKSERNDRTRYPDGAYIDIEHHLLRLALVSEVAPRANKKYVSPTPPPLVNLPSTAIEAMASIISKGKPSIPSSKDSGPSGGASGGASGSSEKGAKDEHGAKEDKKKEESS